MHNKIVVPQALEKPATIVLWNVDRTYNTARMLKLSPPANTARVRYAIIIVIRGGVRLTIDNGNCHS